MGMVTISQFCKKTGIPAHTLLWVKDNRINSGMLETGRKSIITGLAKTMYFDDSISLTRKKVILTTK